MNEVWNLNVIYNGFQDPAFEADLKALKTQVEAFAQLPAKLPTMDAVQGLVEGIRFQEEINRLGTTMLVVTHQMDLVKRFNNRVITIDDGLIVSDRMDGTYHYENQ